MANQEMERALASSPATRSSTSWNEGGHNGGARRRRSFPDAMRWLWKGYPEPIKPGRGSSQQYKEITDPRRGVAGSSARGTSSPRGRPPTPGGKSSSPTSPRARSTRSASAARSARSSPTRKRPTALGFGPDDRLFMPSPPEPSRSSSYAPDFKPTPRSIAEEIAGNDIVVSHARRDLRHQPRRGRPPTEQPGLVTSAKDPDREEGRRYRTRLRQRRGALARPVAPLCDRHAESTGSTATRSSPTARSSTSRSSTTSTSPTPPTTAGPTG